MLLRVLLGASWARLGAFSGGPGGSFGAKTGSSWHPGFPTLLFSTPWSPEVAPKEPPKRSQESNKPPKSPQEPPKASQDAPQAPPSAPKKLPRAPQDPLKSPQQAPLGAELELPSGPSHSWNPILSYICDGFMTARRLPRSVRRSAAPFGARAVLDHNRNCRFQAFRRPLRG